MTESRKALNRIGFGNQEDEYGDSAMGRSLGSSCFRSPSDACSMYFAFPVQKMTLSCLNAICMHRLAGQEWRRSNASYFQKGVHHWHVYWMGFRVGLFRENVLSICMLILTLTLAPTILLKTMDRLPTSVLHPYLLCRKKRRNSERKKTRKQPSSILLVPLDYLHLLPSRQSRSNT